MVIVQPMLNVTGLRAIRRSNEIKDLWVALNISAALQIPTVHS